MEFLKHFRYPGRFIILGKDGEDMVAIYGVTGRSPSSQARKYEERGNEIVVVPTDIDTLNTGNSSLLVYPAYHFWDNGLVVANGNQILKVEKLNENLKNQLDKDLADEKYEPDSNKTPRITGAIFEDKNGAVAVLHISRSNGDDSVNSSWNIPLVSGQGHYIATYKGQDGSPTPSFEGDPLEVALNFGSPEIAAKNIFEMIAPPDSEPDYRISVMACYKKMGEKHRTHIVNKIN